MHKAHRAILVLRVPRVILVHKAHRAILVLRVPRVILVLMVLIPPCLVLRVPPVHKVHRDPLVLMAILDRRVRRAILVRLVGHSPPRLPRCSAASPPGMSELVATGHKRSR